MKLSPEEAQLALRLFHLIDFNWDLPKQWYNLNHDGILKLLNLTDFNWDLPKQWRDHNGIWGCELGGISFMIIRLNNAYLLKTNEWTIECSKPVYKHEPLHVEGSYDSFVRDMIYMKMFDL